MSAKSKKFLGFVLTFVLLVGLVGTVSASTVAAVSTTTPTPLTGPYPEAPPQHAVIRERQFFTQEELLEMIELAPDWSETLHSTPHPFRAMTPEEVAAWSKEYFEMGGLNAQELETIFWLNEERIAYGLPPFVVCPYLSQAARLSAQLLAEQWEPGTQFNRMRHGDLPAHIDPHYGWPTVRALLFAPDNPNSIVALENLMGLSLCPIEAVQAWMNSPSHRITVLSETFDFSALTSLNVDWDNGAKHVGVGMIDGIFAMHVADILPLDHPLHTFFD